MLFNEIYTPIFEKEKVINPTERLVFQLMGAVRLNDKGLLTSYKFASKYHSAMPKKYFILLYVEHIHFLIKRCRWLMTKIYAHYTFEQSKFKKDFVIMNQVSRQNSQTTVEKDFYKLMNTILDTIVEITSTIGFLRQYTMKLSK